MRQEGSKVLRHLRLIWEQMWAFLRTLNFKHSFLPVTYGAIHLIIMRIGLREYSLLKSKSSHPNCISEKPIAYQKSCDELSSVNFCFNDYIFGCCSKIHFFVLVSSKFLNRAIVWLVDHSKSSKGSLKILRPRLRSFLCAPKTSDLKFKFSHVHFVLPCWIMVKTRFGKVLR